MELRVLQYFLAVAREQSIVKAAQSLHLSQPTLSTQIKAMEEELGKQLLIRGSKGSRKVTLTEEGMILRKRAEEILDLVQKTQREIAQSDEVVIGDVHIGAGESDAMRILARAARELRERYPGIRFHIASGNAPFVLEQLDRGLIDFGLVFGMVDADRYKATELPFRETWGVLMPADDPLADRAAVRAEDLWDKPLIISRQVHTGSELAQWLGRQMSELNIAATYNLLFNASLMVAEGLGYAITFDKIVNTTGTDLCFRPLEPGREEKMYLVSKKYQVFSKASEKYYQALRELLASPRSADEAPHR